MRELETAGRLAALGVEPTYATPEEFAKFQTAEVERSAAVRQVRAGPRVEIIMSMEISDHTTKAFDADLLTLTQMIAEMGGCAERQLSDSMALVTRDHKRALRVVAADATIDELQRSIEERAVATIATRQPMAVDLRDIVACSASPTNWSASATWPRTSAAASPR